MTITRCRKQNTYTQYIHNLLQFCQWMEWATDTNTRWSENRNDETFCWSGGMEVREKSWNLSTWNAIKQQRSKNRLRMMNLERREKRGETIEENFEAIVGVVVEVEGRAAMFNNEFSSHHLLRFFASTLCLLWRLWSTTKTFTLQSTISGKTDSKINGKLF